jgi:hypothetical protein
MYDRAYTELCMRMIIKQNMGSSTLKAGEADMLSSASMRTVYTPTIFHRKQHSASARC